MLHSSDPLYPAEASMLMSRFVNPYTDFGFKKIFGEEASKPLLLDFLNAILPPHHQIAALNFKNNEQLGRTEAERKAVYDLYCESTSGEKFIVELQRGKQDYFKDRTIYYSTFPIVEQAQKGEWNYNLSAVYCIGILGFTFDPQDNADVVHTVKLKDQHNRIFYDKLTFIYLEMPNFHKNENELETQLDKWLYFIKHLEDIRQIPTIFKQSDIFQQAFETAEIAAFDDSQRFGYESSLKNFRDNYAIRKTYEREGFESGREAGLAQGMAEGKAKSKREIALKLKAMGMDVTTIAAITELSLAELRAIGL